MDYNGRFTENDLQQMVEEILRPLQSGLPMNPNSTPNFFNNFREPTNNSTINPPNNDYVAIFQSLRDIMVMYNSNISEYNSNISISLQLIRLILEERNRHRPIYRNQSNQVPEAATVHPIVENMDSSNNRVNGTALSSSLRNLRTGRNNDHLFSYILYRPTIRSEDAGALRRFFKNIVVRPTLEQINSATELIPFNVGEENVNNRCPITMEEFTEGELIRQIRHCRHQFQEEPIQNWFRSNVRCPVCRYDIRDYVVPTGSRADSTTEPSPEESIPPNNAAEFIDFLPLPMADNEGNPITNELPGYHELLQEITQNFAADINNIISENYQASMDGSNSDISQNFVFDFHVETNL